MDRDLDSDFDLDDDRVLLLERLPEIDRDPDPELNFDLDFERDARELSLPKDILFPSPLPPLFLKENNNFSN